MTIKSNLSHLSISPVRWHLSIPQDDELQEWEWGTHVQRLWCVLHETIGVESTPDVSDKISQYKVKKNQTVVQAIWLSSVQSSPQSRLSLCDPMDCNTPGLPVHHQLLELTQTLSWVMPSNHLILCCPLLLPSSIFLSIRVFSDESVLLIRWPLGVSASALVLPMNIRD